MARGEKLEADGLLKDLKAFAFEGNRDFRDGRIIAVEQEKTFYHPTEDRYDDDGMISQPLRSTTLSFYARRHRERVRHKPAYVYTLAATAARSIQHIPIHIFESLDEDTQDSLDEIDADSLTEAHTKTYGMSSYELGNIEVTHGYDMSYEGKTFFGTSSIDIVRTYHGDFVDVPAPETDDKTGVMFVEHPIEPEQLHGQFERLINDMAFRAIIDPFRQQDTRSMATFREASAQVYAILDGLRHGIDIERLRDL